MAKNRSKAVSEDEFLRVYVPAIRAGKTNEEIALMMGAAYGASMQANNVSMRASNIRSRYKDDTTMVRIIHPDSPHYGEVMEFQEYCKWSTITDGKRRWSMKVADNRTKSAFWSPTDKEFQNEFEILDENDPDYVPPVELPGAQRKAKKGGSNVTLLRHLLTGKESGIDLGELESAVNDVDMSDEDYDSDEFDDE